MERNSFSGVGDSERAIATMGLVSNSDTGNLSPPSSGRLCIPGLTDGGVDPVSGKPMTQDDLANSLCGRGGSGVSNLISIRI